MCANNDVSICFDRNKQKQNKMTHNATMADRVRKHTRLPWLLGYLDNSVRREIHIVIVILRLGGHIKSNIPNQGKTGTPYIHNPVMGEAGDQNK